jgi:hypothetical protein
MGRPKKISAPVSTAFLFRNTACKTVVVQTAFGETSMTNWEALARMVQNLALDGNQRAAQLFFQMRKRFPGKPAPCGTIIRVLSDQDCRV